MSLLTPGEWSPQCLIPAKSTWLHTYTYIYMYTCIYVYVHIHADMTTRACIHIYTCAHARASTHPCVHAGIYDIHIHKHACTHEYPHIHSSSGTRDPGTLQQPFRAPDNPPQAPVQGLYSRRMQQRTAVFTGEGRGGEGTGTESLLQATRLSLAAIEKQLQAHSKSVPASRVCKGAYAMRCVPWDTMECVCYRVCASMECVHHGV